ncbi:hypothetical protein MAR_004535, partial [Mya arenaria]
LPGACLLTLQKSFGECFGKVGLSPEIYLSNSSDHAGALIGANTAEAKEYCNKKQDLFTCMNEVIHKCPGAEQTLSLTGFDLHGMERACMEDMTMAITDLSTKQITQQLNMEVFFEDFCSARVKHVACDGSAWPSCDTQAVSLKNEFECQLIPSRCYNSHKDNIDTICPNTGVPECVRNIHESMNSCFTKFNMKPDMSKGAVFQCMRDVLSQCNLAEAVLSYWGHQQSSVEEAVNVICNDLQMYGKGQQCFSSGNAQTQQCISNTESKMMDLADKQVQKKLSPDAYFRDFCSISMEQLRCDLNGWKTSCAKDVVGLKTEFECSLVQKHCKNLQVRNFNEMCNEATYATALRASGGGGGGNGGGGGSGTAGGAGGQTGPGGVASATSASVFAVLTGVLASLVLLL